MSIDALVEQTNRPAVCCLGSIGVQHVEVALQYGGSTPIVVTHNSTDVFYTHTRSLSVVMIYYGRQLDSFVFFVLISFYYDLR